MEFFAEIEKATESSGASGSKRVVTLHIQGANADAVFADMVLKTGTRINGEYTGAQVKLIEDEVSDDQVTIDDIEHAHALEMAEGAVPGEQEEESGFIIDAEEGRMVIGDVEYEIGVDLALPTEAEPMLEDDVPPPPADDDAVTDIPTAAVPEGVKMTPELAKAMYAKTLDGKPGMKTVAPLRFKTYDGPLGLTFQVTGTSDLLALKAEAEAFFAFNGVTKIERVAVIPAGGAEFVAKVEVSE